MEPEKFSRKAFSLGIVAAVALLACCVLSPRVLPYLADIDPVCFLECAPPTTPITYEALPPSRFFRTPDCLIACWEGLRPGETQIMQVQERFGPLHPNQLENNQVYHTAYYRDSPPSVYATFNSDYRLLSLEITGPFQLRLRDVIQQLGIPEYTSIYTRSGGAVIQGAALLTLYYPEAGFIFETKYNDENRDDGSAEACITEEDVIVNAVVVPSGSIESMLEDANFPEPGFIEWPGYTCLNVSY